MSASLIDDGTTFLSIPPDLAYGYIDGQHYRIVDGRIIQITGNISHPVEIPPKPTDIRPVLTTIWQRRIKRSRQA